MCEHEKTRRRKVILPSRNLMEAGESAATRMSQMGRLSFVLTLEDGGSGAGKNLSTSATRIRSPNPYSSNQCNGMCTSRHLIYYMEDVRAHKRKRSYQSLQQLPHQPCLPQPQRHPHGVQSALHWHFCWSTVLFRMREKRSPVERFVGGEPLAVTSSYSNLTRKKD